MYGETADVVRPKARKELGKKGATLESATTMAPTYVASSSPKRNETKESKKTKFCMYHLQGVCLHIGDSCRFAHSVEEMQTASFGQKEQAQAAFGGLKEQAKICDRAKIGRDNLIDLTFSLFAAKLQSQSGPRVSRKTSIKPPIAALAPAVLLSTRPDQGNVQHVQSSSTPDRNSAAWPKLGDPMYVHVSICENPRGCPNATAQEMMCGEGLKTGSAQILSTPPPTSPQVSSFNSAALVAPGHMPDGFGVSKGACTDDPYADDYDPLGQLVGA